ncbi:hypothetical protein ACIRP3_00765 [Streptomyces sp. NPDC101209]|uniref:hypothetical protein n=1 Tax=Streptomyces sp. NPDC101209 TaxID=3366129 RepID=UPI0038018C5B
MQMIIAIALFSGYGSTDQSPAKAAERALTVLRERTVVELFGVLPADLEDVLDEDAVYPDGDHVVEGPGGSDVPYGILGTER